MKLCCMLWVGDRETGLLTLLKKYDAKKMRL